MANITMTEIEKVLGTEVEELDSDAIDRVEAFIDACNVAAADFDGEPLVEDAIYDRLIEILKETSPESGLLAHLWDDTEDVTTTDIDPELDKYLLNHPMLSIQTVKSWNEPGFMDLFAAIEDMKVADNGTSIFFASKINGHGIRVVYKDGRLVKATSRARASKGRNITRQMRNILGEYNENLAALGIVEIRGEVCLHTSKMDEARKFNPTVKSPFSAVSSLLKPSSTPEENSLLEFLAYRGYYDGSGFDTREEEYQFLDESGFDTPYYVSLEVSDEEDTLDAITEVFNEFEDNYEEYGYFCDGVVLEINDQYCFDSMGTEGPRSKGNVALKVGAWEQNLYSGYVQTIIWAEGKSKFSPVAIVATEPGMATFNEDNQITNMNELGVLTSNGATVRNVPLYEPKNILILEAYKDNPIHFRFGGESGVVPCDPMGRLLKDGDTIQDILTSY